MDKILVVEDDSALGLGIEFAIRKEGFEVLVVNTMNDALSEFKNAKFDLILLDVMLPDGNGYEVCRKVREKSQIPIIFLTACDEEVNVVLGLDIGGDDYITKPFRVKELISRIRVALRRAKREEKTINNCIKSGDVALYQLETKVVKWEEELYLTPVEYKLLRMFMSNPKQTLTRDIILNKLWDIEGEFVDDNTLSVYIRRLREKLEDNPSSPKYIVTVRGMGYKWSLECENKELAI